MFIFYSMCKQISFFFLKKVLLSLMAICGIKYSQPILYYTIMKTNKDCVGFYARIFDVG